MISPISVNRGAARELAILLSDADALKIAVSMGPLGDLQIDAGAKIRGGISAGVAIAKICLGGLADVGLITDATLPRWPWTISVRTSQPVIACLGSQYAGWRLSQGEGKGAFFAMGSGPARVLARREVLYEELDYRDEAKSTTLVIESARPLPPELVAKVASDCKLAPSALSIIFAPTQSLAGGVQIVARVLEVALHKAHTLKFPLDRIVDGFGAAPLSPPHPDFVESMGRTNDAIIYGGRVHLFVTGAAEDARSLAEALPSHTSRDYGSPFRDIFKKFKGDFYAIDPMLFSPAEALVTSLDSGKTFRAGGGQRRVDRRVVQLNGIILLISDTNDWHARRMEAAYVSRGVKVVRLDLASCHFDTSSRIGLNVPGYNGGPCVVHVRTMAAGSFEAVTKRLGVLHALERLGASVVNSPRAIEACVDKSMTSFLISRGGIPTPATWTIESQEQARALVRREIENGPLVLKPLFGAQGKGLRLLQTIGDLPAPGAVAGVYYLQRFVPTPEGDFRDFRVFVAGAKAIAMMLRRSKTWITNVKQGGFPESVAHDEGLERLAVAATRATGAEIAGVDIIVGRNGPLVLEVNSMPAWSGLQRVAGADIAEAIANHILSRATPFEPDP